MGDVDGSDADPIRLIGSTATVVGLRSKPELNGTTAVIRSFNATSSRYNVDVATSPTACSTMALKSSNLEQAAGRARLPPAVTIEDDAYTLAATLQVLDVIDSIEEYDADVAVACLTKCVEGLMSEASEEELPQERVLLAATNALRTNARNECSAPQLYGIAILNLPFLLGSREQAAALGKVEASLSCSLLELLVQGIVAYKDQQELLSGAMIALRQLLASYADADDAADFAGVDDALLPTVASSGMLAALRDMLAEQPPTLEDEGSLELHEHAIAACLAVCGMRPDADRAKMIVDAGLVPSIVRAMAAVTPNAPSTRPKAKAGKEAKEAFEASLELNRSAGRLLGTLGGTRVGRDGMRSAGVAAALQALLSAFPQEKAVQKEIGALKKRLDEEELEEEEEVIVEEEKERAMKSTTEPARPDVIKHTALATSKAKRGGALEVIEATYYY